MKIIADAGPLYAGQFTGIGYFADELLRQLALTCEVEAFAFNFKKVKDVSAPYLVHEQTIIPGKLLTYPRHLGIDLPLGLFFKLKGDAILGTNYLVPPTGSTPTFSTVHDLCFLDHPEWVQSSNAKVLRRMLPKTLKRSRGIVTISEFTASRIRRLYSYDKPILVIAIPPKQSSVTAVMPRITLQKNKFFLFVSTIEPRKNVGTLLDAYGMLDASVQAEYPLVLAGKPGWDETVLERLRAKKNKNIHYLDYVSEGERNWLYDNATCTIVPSHYEGFGMMTLEALDRNCPVITSDIPPQREILGDNGLYFAPTAPEELKVQMEKLVQQDFRETLLKNQQKVLVNYSWQKTAKQVRDFIAENI